MEWFLLYFLATFVLQALGVEILSKRTASTEPLQNSKKTPNALQKLCVFT